MPFVTRAQIRIYYEWEGAGPAVVLHTGAGGDSRIWRDAGYVAALEGFTRIMIDQRGRGRSDRPPTVEAHSMEEYAQDVGAVLDAIGVSTAAFFGYSSGILVGVAFAGKFPGRLNCLVGLGALRFRDPTELPPVDPDSEIRQVVAEGGVVHELEARMNAENDRFPESIDRNVRAGDPQMLALDGVAWRQWRGPRSVLQRQSFPMLMLTGEREDPDRATENTVAHCPAARMVRVGGVGHLGVFYRSDLTLPLAVRFIEEHARGTGRDAPAARSPSGGIGG